MNSDEITDNRRLIMRERPAGWPIMHQHWGKLLFMHWRIDEQLLRTLIPEALEIDTFDGSAWIGRSFHHGVYAPRSFPDSGTALFMN